MKVRAALGSIATVLVLAGCSMQPNDYTLPGQVAVGSDGYTVTVAFDQVANLVPNSAVELNDVVVGTVASIDVSNWRARVRLRLLKSASIPSNATFSIGQKTLLGAQYVEVNPPRKARATALMNGATIPRAQTGIYPATEQVLGAVALLMNNGGLSQISTITSQLSAAFSDHVPDTRDLIRRSTDLLRVLDENKSQVVGALQALNRLSSGLASDQSELGTAIDRLAPGLRSLEQERQTLVRALRATDSTGAVASRVIDAGRRGLLESLNGLRPVLANLQSVSTVLPDALKFGLTIPFPAMTTTNELRGDYSNLVMTFDLRGSTLANSWLAGLLMGQGTQGTTGSRTVTQKTNRTSPSGPGPSTTASSGSVGSPSPSGGSCLLAVLGLC